MGARVAPLGARRRTWTWLAIAAVIAVFLAVRGVVAWHDWRQPAPKTTAAGSAALPARSIGAGAVAVRIQPRQIDAEGAAFQVSLDTHSFALDLDVARQAQLVVGASTWPVAGWSGDGPGGHHREGVLRFNPAGPATGTATLTIGGLPKPVVATWQLGT